MRRTLRILCMVCLVAVPGGCSKNGIVVGVLAVRAAVVIAAAIGSSERSHGDADWGSLADREPGPVDLDNVRGVLAAAAMRVRGCARKHPQGPRGHGVAHVSIEPSGQITDVTLDAAFAGTAVGACVVDEVLASGVKPYRGEPMVVIHWFVVD